MNKKKPAAPPKAPAAAPAKPKPKPKPKGAYMPDGTFNPYYRPPKDLYKHKHKAAKKPKHKKKAEPHKAEEPKKSKAKPVHSAPKKEKKSESKPEEKKKAEKKEEGNICDSFKKEYLVYTPPPGKVYGWIPKAVIRPW